MPAFERCALRPMAASDLQTVLQWRNHPAIRSSMLHQEEIRFADHQAWFERASTDTARRLLVAIDGDAAVGFVHFTHAVPAAVSDWGFYAAPGAAKGTGTRLCAAALDLAFGELGLHKVCGQVLDTNPASARLHMKLGFVQEGLLREHHLIGSRHHNLVCFGILKREWQ